MTPAASSNPASEARSLCTEAIVECYESLVELARVQVDCLRRGDMEGFGRIVEEKGTLIGRIRRSQDEANVSAEAQESIPARIADRLAERAEKALAAVLEKEAEALALVSGLRDAIGSELAHVTRGDAGLQSYRGAVAARLVDERR